MAFLLILVKPRLTGDKRWPWSVCASNSSYAQEAHDEADARRYIENLVRNSGVSTMVVFCNKEDRPDRAYAIKNGVWRDLGLIAKHPDPTDYPWLYSGQPWPTEKSPDKVKN